MGSEGAREVHEGCSPRSAAPDATPASLLPNSRREILRSMCPPPKSHVSRADTECGVERNVAILNDAFESVVDAVFGLTLSNTPTLLMPWPELVRPEAVNEICLWTDSDAATSDSEFETSSSTAVKPSPAWTRPSRPFEAPEQRRQGRGFGRGLSNHTTVAIGRA